MVQIAGAVLIAAFATLAAGCAESVPSSPVPTTQTSNSGN
jgi:hypothetical protein